MDSIIYSDFLVIGAGLAGERAAIEAVQSGLDVKIVTLVPPRRSHSSAAQGGMQAAFGYSEMSKDDSSFEHFKDTVRGSDWGCDQKTAGLFCDSAVDAVKELDGWGVPWTRINDKSGNDGLIAARNFGGTAKWRTCYCADGTGHSLMMAMDNTTAKYGIPVFDRCEAVSLIMNEDRCTGAIVLDLRSGKPVSFIAKAVLIATGGYGQLFEKTTNALICNGTGLSLVLNTGKGVLANMEAVQFHPTATVPDCLLITEGCRGDGGFLLDVNFHRFMPDYEPEAEDLASRDVVARRMIRHIADGFGVKSNYGMHLWLDIRHLGKKHIADNLREVREMCINFLGIDPVNELIPVYPAQHYSMGGIRTDINCCCEDYGIKGLFAAGESACWDIHGFNRLGGNSLAETVVAGKIAGRKASDWIRLNNPEISMSCAEHELKCQSERIRKIMEKSGGVNCFEIKSSMKKILTESAGVFRNKRDLEKALAELKELLKKSENVSLKMKPAYSSPELPEALRITGMIHLALCIVKGALLREESRGAHYREDFPNRNDELWLKRSLFRLNSDSGEPEVFYENVDVSDFPPGKRGYGEK